MMGYSRDLVLTCLICLLLFRADARVPGAASKGKEKATSEDTALAKAPASSKGKSTSPAEAPTTPDANATAPAAAPTTPGSNSTASPATPGTASEGTVFDVTKHGAVGDGKTDNNKAFTAAWAAACKSTGPSTLLVPSGDFLVSPITFAGPCTKAPLVEIKGKILAPTTIVSTPSNAWILFKGLSHLNITGAGIGTVDGQGETAWTENNCRHTTSSNCKVLPTTIQLSGITGGSLSDITFLNSKAFHVTIGQSNDFIIHDVKITAPGSSPNTDGIHISDSTGITVTNSVIGTGDDCVSIGAGTSNIAVTNIQCGPGHGISLGSLGKYPNEKAVKGLLVKNCSFTSTDNGVRIKTWPGAPDNTVSDIRFEDITMTNVSNPIIINQKYCDKKACESTPSRVKLTDIHFKNIKGTSFKQTAVSLICSEGAPCEGVELVDIELKPAAGNGDANSTCVNVKGVTTSGVQVPKPTC
ncbi:exopolygalacturonase-like [Macadamia integrifolia]|uniref:exopolygalacturonase-like n=1 Tax=Macadamia integrifolia TaxID=60698 RepID=UPI001C4EE75E|nr:exopolygalacturonase-like [Macadamia integrifolia]